MEVGYGSIAACGITKTTTNKKKTTNNDCGITGNIKKDLGWFKYKLGQQAA
jgi:hypothetical protein